MKANSFSTILIDDEELALSALNYLIDDYCPELKVDRVFLNPLDAKNYLKSNKVDIAFIDIKMPGENGLDLVQSLEKTKTKYIFSTAYTEYALEAWQTNAVGYLQKPIDPDELIQTVKKVTSIIKPEPEQIFFKFSKIELNIEKIISGKAAGSYTNVYYVNSQSTTVTGNIQKVIDALPCNKIFRINREAFINAMFLKSYDQKNKIISLTNGDTFKVSIRRAGDFINFLKTHNYQW